MTGKARTLTHGVLAVAVVALGATPLASAEDDLITSVYREFMEFVACELMELDEDYIEPLLGPDYPGQPTVRVIYGWLQPGGLIYDTLYSVVYPVGSTYEEVMGEVTRIGDEVLREGEAVLIYVAEQGGNTYYWARDAKCYVADTLFLLHECADLVNVYTDGRDPVGVGGSLCNVYALTLERAGALLSDHVGNAPLPQAPPLPGGLPIDGTVRVEVVH